MIHKVKFVNSENYFITCKDYNIKFVPKSVISLKVCVLVIYSGIHF